MKKIILLALLAVGIVPAFAQISVGVIGGYNLNSIYPKSNHESFGYKVSSRSGWRAGLVADKRLWKSIHLQPQLVLNEKGYNSAYSPNEAPIYLSAKFKTRLLYLELQANMLFKQQIGSGSLFIGGGPYIARGISGTDRLDEQYYDMNGVLRTRTQYYVIDYRNKLPEYGYGTVQYMKPYDAGLNFLAGFELKNGLFFNVTYSMELNNHRHTKSFESKNTYFGITAGYFLKRFS